jgi:hypothetical protein
MHCSYPAVLCRYNQYFGIYGDAPGTLVYGTSELIVASDCTITLEMKVISSRTGDTTSIAAAASTGFWPFFRADASGGETSHEISPDGKILKLTQKATDPTQAFVIGRKIYNVFDL